MTHEDIRAALSRGWLDKRDRARLEAQLAEPAHSLSAGATTDAFEHIAIEGDGAFIAATRRALRMLRGTSGWSHARNIRRIKPCDTGLPVGGALVGNTAEFETVTWQGDPAFYASSIGHEGVHAGGVDGSADGERRALTLQAKVLRELGAPRATVETIERHAAHPTAFHLGGGK